MKILKTYRIFETYEQNLDMIASAKMKNDYNIFKKIKQGADINYKDTVNGQTALMIVCYSSQNIDTIRYLLENGADPNIQDLFGNTALLYAARKYAFYNVIELLLKYKANMRLENNNGECFVNANKDWINNNKQILQICLKHDESIISEFKKYNIIIDDETKKKYPHLFTGLDLNLL